MTAFVRFETSKFEKSLSMMSGRIDNLNAVTKRLSLDLLVAVENQFETQGRGKWAPLKASTIERHPRRSGGRLLVDTGTLVNSLTPNSGANFFAVFTNNPYSKFHVTGTRNMVKRDFLAIDIGPILTEMADELMMEITRP